MINKIARNFVKGSLPQGIVSIWYETVIVRVYVHDFKNKIRLSEPSGHILSYEILIYITNVSKKMESNFIRYLAYEGDILNLYITWHLFHKRFSKKWNRDVLYSILIRQYYTILSFVW